MHIINLKRKKQQKKKHSIHSAQILDVYFLRKIQNFLQKPLRFTGNRRENRSLVTVAHTNKKRNQKTTVVPGNALHVRDFESSYLV